MTIPPRTRLGPYELLSPLGAGGMGEVYRARDTKLGRDVAIKVLPRQWSPGLVGGRTLDLHPDGQRFAVLKAAEHAEEERHHLVFIENFFDELRRVAPPAK